MYFNNIFLILRGIEQEKGHDTLDYVEWLWFLDQLGKTNVVLKMGGLLIIFLGTVSCEMLQFFVFDWG